MGRERVGKRPESTGSARQSVNILETERLVIREWTADDVEALGAICSDPAVMRFVGDGTPWSQSEAQAFIERARTMAESCGFCQWALAEKSCRELIGFCGFVPHQDGAEIGWRLAPSAWGRGFATEAARTVLQHGFQHFEFPEIVATVQPANSASMRVIQKLGMTYRAAVVRHGREVHVYGRPHPSQGRPSPSSPR